MNRKNYKSSTIRGKLRVCRYLQGSKTLASLVPRTAALTLAGLKTMSQTHASLYIKPDVGSLGIGIFKLNRLAQGFELLGTRRRQTTRREFATVQEVYRHLKAAAKGRMIVQAAIRLDKAGNSPYDMRVMMQRKPKGNWTCTGAFVKVGKPGKIVTNFYQGGQIITLRELWQRKGLGEGHAAGRTRRLEEKALAVSRLLSSKKRGMHEMGIDFAYDRKGKLWVLEVNSNHPQYHPLRQVDEVAYNRMRSFAKSYGRLSDK
ncbi:putative circularly permuted ATP-grasp superfamily protein [Paenibacillus phyllosphaerae]|uniref:Putative circularly permuted ATP-grasp superfamily protein n=1 Tax=Paenibacillus phyllosphaerae TaxID=274593 RepID=A0A7W5FP66_9BACL|nr:YheC/YheD family protein [Paenibacillus phyllosphaerae]MBB3112046.1 putative circularly permuted ATP-grasp superfamily protein [Paenibacillus phyllosphaerae]